MAESPAADGGTEIAPEPKPKEGPRWQPRESGWDRGSSRRLVPGAANTRPRGVRVFEKVDQRVSFPELEIQLMKRWKEEGTFERSLEVREGKPRFVFYEGPPTANGKPATHHILARAFKDLFGRYKTMKGFYVERKAGWDTHGLPVEIEVEKKLNISGKFEIENEIGVEKFNELCRQSVYEYVEDWRVFSERMAFWQDYDHAYWTLTPEYIQSVWWALSEMWRQNLIYKGFRVAPYCSRCATPLSSHELAQGYRDNVPDPSVYIRFRLKKDPTTSILAWTTTPWTLPGNVALAVAPDVVYIKVKEGDEHLILAEARLTVLKEPPQVEERMLGRDLVGLEYEPLYPYSVPEHIKTGRMGDWLENNVDWQFSRSRFWGTPVPIWVCEECDEKRIVSTAAELGLKEDADLHRPYIDEVTLSCTKCGGLMRRVPEVMDTWFDSGSMPFAQRGYPRHGKEIFEQTFPADFISEAVDQTRGWFYTLLAISTLLFNQNSYRNVICLGHVVDPKGKKASKSRGNVLDPNYLFDTFGSDAVRWYFYTSTQVGENYRTGDAALRETVQQFFIPLWNCYSFFVTYARLYNFDPAQPQVPVRERHVLDRWLLSKLSGLVASVAGGLDAYEPVEPARRIHRFVDDLSNWYIRRSRRRFWKSQSDRDKAAAYQTLYEALRTVSGLMAPFTPFVSDAIYRNLSEGKSVHLSDFPVAVAPEDLQVEADMARARHAVEAGLAARDAARLKVRQPLASIAVPGDPLPEDIAVIVRDELNVKSMTFGAPEVKLDTVIGEDLKLEGLAREVVRLVQDRRKKLGLNVEDRIDTRYDADGMIARAIERHADYIKAETLSVTLPHGREDGFVGEQLMLEGEQIWIALKRS